MSEILVPVSFGELKWGTKIEFDDVMDLVTVDDAIAAFERYRADQTLGAR